MARLADDNFNLRNMKSFYFTMFFVGMYVFIAGITFLALAFLQSLFTPRALTISIICILMGFIMMYIGWKDNRGR